MSTRALHKRFAAARLPPCCCCCTARSTLPQPRAPRHLVGLPGGCPGPSGGCGAPRGSQAQIRVFDPVQNNAHLKNKLLIRIVFLGLGSSTGTSGGLPGPSGAPEIVFSSTGRVKRPSRALPPRTPRAFRGSLEISFSSTGRAGRQFKSGPLQGLHGL